MISVDSLHLIKTGFSQQKALVIGDLMLDEYLYGEADRVSPEAPVPVVGISRRDHRAGGAGNVAVNLAALGVQVAVTGFVGDDAAGQETGDLLRNAGVDTSHLLTLDAPKHTVTKTRLVAGPQQIVRFDSEHNAAPEEADLKRLLECVEQVFAGDAAPSFVILSDYAKGTLSEAVCQQAISIARANACIVYVDPKGDDYRKYRGASAITPNLKELESWKTAEGQVRSDRHAFYSQQLAELDLDCLIVTLGANGMEGVTDQGVVGSAAKAREVFDVSGAGDTAIAVLATCHACGLSMEDSMAAANAASGIAVSKMGTFAVGCQDLLDVLDDRVPRDDGELGRPQLLDQVMRWRQSGDRIVFTNGCFDILHAGHVRLLTAAAGLGTRLVVAINSDASVTRLKGLERPFVGQKDRSLLIRALACVDAVTVFDEDTPLELIKMIRPDVLVKGGDYEAAAVVGYDAVTSAGGQVVIIPLEPDRSTTRLVDKVHASRSASKTKLSLSGEDQG